MSFHQLNALYYISAHSIGLGLNISRLNLMKQFYLASKFCLPDREPLDRDPLDRDAPRQRLPRQRPPDRDPLLDRDPPKTEIPFWTETPRQRPPIWTETPRQRCSWIENPWTETPLDRDHLDRDPLLDRDPPSTETP